MPMNTGITAPGLACFALLLLASLSFAESAAVSTMADITMNLNHFPSDSDKQKLMAITNGDLSSESEQAVASAILNLQHRVRDADKKILNSIISDGSAPADLRELAAVLVNINHSPSDSDVEKLAALVADSGFRFRRDTK